MKAYIYTGGKINASAVTENPNDGDIIIAADSGYSNARTLGVTPQILLGDFDSLGTIPEDISEIISVPAEKDFTDTQMAIDTALSKGADEIIIIGGLGGRLDHTLSNLSILEYLHSKNVKGLITDGNDRVRYLKNDSIIILRSEYKYISLIARSEKVKGVEIAGCKYPLKNAQLSDKYQFAVSNEIEGNCAFISVKKGAVLIIESKDQA